MANVNWDAILSHIGEKNDFFIFIGSVSLFLIFKDIRLKSKIINNISSCTFAVYLIHNNHFFHEFLWMHIFKSSLYERTMVLIPYSIFAICSTYFVCVLIESFRVNVVHKALKPIYEICFNKINDRIDKLQEKLDGELYHN